MPSTFTNSLRLVLPATGELSNTWGTVFNAGATSLIDTSIAGTASITMTAADYTLSNSNGVADEARAMVLSLGGTPGGSYNVICPTVSKVYIVYNNTGFAQTIKTSAGTGVSVANGATVIVRCDGTNVVQVVSQATGDVVGPASAVNNNLAAFDGVTGKLIKQAATVTAAQGGTGLTTFTAANNAIYSTSASALTAGTLPILAGGTGATTAATALSNLGGINTGKSIAMAMIFGY